MADGEIYDRLFEADFTLRQGAAIAGCNLWSIRSWLQQGILRLFHGDEVEEGGRRERWISPATVVTFAILDAAMRDGISTKRAGEVARSFVDCGKGTGGWRREPPEPRKPTRLPGQLFTCADKEVAAELQTWAAFPAGEAPAKIIPVHRTETFADVCGRVTPQGGRGIQFLPLDEVVVGTLIRCRQEPRRPRRTVEQAEVVDGAA